MSLDNLAEAAEVAAAYTEYVRKHRFEFFPYNDFHDWQKEFFAAGKDHRERMVLAGNRTGKTLSSTYEVACHATGIYPEGWTGMRFDFPPTVWVLGVDGTQVKDVVQSELFGILGDHGYDGTGWIPNELVSGFARHGQVVGLARDVVVKHVTGGESRVSFRAYTQSNRGAGTTAFAGSSVDLILVDEQPADPELHGQLVTRTMTGNRKKGGSIIYSMTPELGVTELIAQYMERRGPHQHLTQVTWDDCPHLTPAIQTEILASIPEWQHDMRMKGIPFMGSGAVFKTPESRLKVEPFEIPAYYTWLAGIDFGIDHPTAWAKCAYDRENDVVYLISCYRKAGEMVAEHARYIRGADKGWIDTVYPHDGDNREKGSGRTLAELYRDAGVKMVRKFHNLDKDKTNFVEPGLQIMDERMRTDRFKVFDAPANDVFFAEYRRYHRDEKGKLVKVDDDTIDAVRYVSVMIPRYGKNETEATDVYGGGDSLAPGIEI
jgi:phage terminase large subunit-like protein